MNIYDRIVFSAVEHKSNTGVDAVNVYLGRDEITELLKWAYENGYIGVVDKPDLEGCHRPEVHGLFVYKVNADRHLCCS